MISTHFFRPAVLTLTRFHCIISGIHRVIFNNIRPKIFLAIYHHHPVPCFIALAIMSFHIPRSFVAFRISTTLPAPSQLASASVIFSRCFPLLRFPSIIPVVMRCSNFSLLITWPKNVVCRVQILFTSALDVWASFSTVLAIYTNTIFFEG